jgi:hypothetical protein
MNSLRNFNYNGQVIQKREDGFINLTQMCQANGKRLDHFLKANKTKDYIESLSNSLQTGVVDTKEGINGGTWGHPSLSINLARWISSDFAVWCDAHIFNLMETGQTSLSIDPIEEMKLKIELARLESQKTQTELSLVQFRHTICLTCPEPIQQRILGYQTIKETEIVERVIDSSTGEYSDGVGITYIAKVLGFKNTNQCWAWLEQKGYGKNSGEWENQLTAINTPKLSRDDLAILKESIQNPNGRQLFVCE